MEQQANQISTWAIVEIMGHQTVAGFVRTEAFGGTVMLRVELPALPERKRMIDRDWDSEHGGWITAEQLWPAEPATTQYIGMGSIYRLSPCTEETARAAAEHRRREAPKLLNVKPYAQSSLPGAVADDVPFGGAAPVDEADEIERMQAERREADESTPIDEALVEAMKNPKF